MKLAIAAVSALTLISAAGANAAVASYDFESGTIGDVSLAGPLAPLGVTSSTITGATGGIQGVYNNGGSNPNASFGNKSFAIGNAGTWTLVFGGSGVSSLSLAYNETETSGFVAHVYDLAGTTILQTLNINGGGANSVGTMSFTGLGAIGKFEITDVFDGAHPQGDNVQLDNLSVNTITGIPEPSTYMMIGSALAGLAAFRRRRA